MATEKQYKGFDMQGNPVTGLPLATNPNDAVRLAQMQAAFGQFSLPAPNVLETDIGKLASIRDDGTVGPYAYDSLSPVLASATIGIPQWLAAVANANATTSFRIVQPQFTKGLLIGLSSNYGVQYFYLRKRIVNEAADGGASTPESQLAIGATLADTRTALEAFLSGWLIDWDLVSCAIDGSDIVVTVQANGANPSHKGIATNEDLAVIYEINDGAGGVTDSHYNLLNSYIPAVGQTVTVKSSFQVGVDPPVEDVLASYVVQLGDNAVAVGDALEAIINANTGTTGFACQSTAIFAPNGAYFQLYWPYWERDAQAHAVLIEGLVPGTGTGAGDSIPLTTMQLSLWNFTGGMDEVIASVVQITDTAKPQVVTITAGVQVPANAVPDDAATAIAAWIVANVPEFTASAVGFFLSIASTVALNYTGSDLTFDGSGNGGFAVVGRPLTPLPARPVFGRIASVVEDANPLLTTAVVEFPASLTATVINQGAESAVPFPGYRVFPSNGGDGVVSDVIIFKPLSEGTLYLGDDPNTLVSRMGNAALGVSATAAAIGADVLIVTK